MIWCIHEYMICTCIRYGVKFICKDEEIDECPFTDATDEVFPLPNLSGTDAEYLWCG